MNDLFKILSVCVRDPNPAGYRDAAMIVLIAATGIRRYDIASLLPEDYGCGPQTMIISRTRKVNPLPIPLPVPVVRYIHEWLPYRNPFAKHMFLAVNKHGAVTSRKMTANGVVDMVRERGEQAGVDIHHPVDVRRIVLTDVIERGFDLRMVCGTNQPLDVDRIVQFDCRGNERLQQQVAMLARIPTKGELLV